MAATQRMLVGDFLVDRGRREIRRKDEIIHVSSKAFHLLELLIDAAPNAVSRDDLYRGLWPDTFVEEANLTNLIKEIRKALEDDGRSQRLIKTLHGYGYALNTVPESHAEAWVPFVLVWGSREFPLKRGENVIGRDPGADIRIDSAGVSRQHACLFAGAGGVTIRDLGSKNGTFVGGSRIDAPAPLVDDTEFRLGSAVLRVRPIAANETTMTVGEARDSAS